MDDTLQCVIAELRNDANRDCVYNHDDLRALALRLEKLESNRGSGRSEGGLTMGQNAEIRIPIEVYSDEIAKARISGVKSEMEALLGVIQRVNVELDAMDAKMNRLRAAKHTGGNIPSSFVVGDTVAYLDDDFTGWKCWEVKSCDGRFLYSGENGHGDSIAREFAILVKASDGKARKKGGRR